MQILVVQQWKNPNGITAYVNGELFMASYDIDYRDSADPPSEGLALGVQYQQAVEAAYASPGEPQELGDGDTLTLVSVSVV